MSTLFSKFFYFFENIFSCYFKVFLIVRFIVLNLLYNKAIIKKQIKQYQINSIKKEIKTMSYMDFENNNEYYKNAFERIGLIWETGDYVDDGYAFEERD